MYLTAVQRPPDYHNCKLDRVRKRPVFFCARKAGTRPHPRVPSVRP
jgi:hypothetical protein